MHASCTGLKKIHYFSFYNLWVPTYKQELKTCQNVEALFPKLVE